MHVRKFFYLLHLQEHPFTFASFLGVEEEKQMVFTGISIHPGCLLENWKGKEGDRGLGQEEEEGSSQAQTIKYKCIQAANITQKHILIQIYIQTYNIRHIHTQGHCLLSSLVLVVFHLGLRRVSFLSFLLFSLLSFVSKKALSRFLFLAPFMLYSPFVSFDTCTCYLQKNPKKNTTAMEEIRITKRAPDHGTWGITLLIIGFTVRYTQTGDCAVSDKQLQLQWVWCCCCATLELLVGACKWLIDCQPGCLQSFLQPSGENWGKDPPSSSFIHPFLIILLLLVHWHSYL